MCLPVLKLNVPPPLPHLARRPGQVLVLVPAPTKARSRAQTTARRAARESRPRHPSPARWLQSVCVCVQWVEPHHTQEPESTNSSASLSLIPLTKLLTPAMVALPASADDTARAPPSAAAATEGALYRLSTHNTRSQSIALSVALFLPLSLSPSLPRTPNRKSKSRQSPSLHPGCRQADHTQQASRSSSRADLLSSRRLLLLASAAAAAAAAAAAPVAQHSVAQHAMRGGVAAIASVQAAAAAAAAVSAHPRYPASQR
jgi:hypothetical protein